MSIPLHIAFIMDGNARWGKKVSRDGFFGYTTGLDVMLNVIQHSLSMGVKYLTFYAFSSENFFRSSSFLCGLFSHFEGLLSSKKSEIVNSSDIKYNFIGDIDKFNQNIVDHINYISYMTRNNSKIYVNIALGYGSRNEIVYAVTKLFNSCENQDLKKVIDGLNYDFLSNFMYTRDFPDPDLLIRTGGEKRLSNFLLLQSSYTELYFTDTLWPDFNSLELQEAINDFMSRDRKYGK